MQAASISPRSRPHETAQALVGVVYDPAAENGPALAAYTQILHEEGFSYASISDHEVVAAGAAALARRFSALVLPDEAARNLSDETVAVLHAYVRRYAGQLIVAYDAGIAYPGGRLRSTAALADLVGADYWTPGRPAPRGIWVIPRGSSLRGWFDPALYNPDHAIQVYGYPPMRTQHLHLRKVTAQPLAWGALYGQNAEDAIVLDNPVAGGGDVFYLNAPLGYQKYHHNDDFLLRNLLRYTLIGRLHVPRLVAAPGGVGGLLLNIHVCSGVYYPDLAQIKANGLLSPELRYSFHVTAGPDENTPGDRRGIGVDSSRGRMLVRDLARHGSVGSQGGWIHNYFATHLDGFSDSQVVHYLDQNFAVLQQATGQPVVEYSAPGGAHSPLMNDVLARWGTRGAAIPNSFYSPPTHAWWNHQREDRFWLFGYSGTQYGYCLSNMRTNGRTGNEIASDVEQLLRTTVRFREIRQLYEHPSELTQDPRVWQSIQSSIVDKVHQGKLTVRTMSEYADFLDRHARVEWGAERTARGFRLKAHSPSSLREMTFALPVYGKPLAHPAWGKVDYQGDWAYVTVTRDIAAIDEQLIVDNSKT